MRRRLQPLMPGAGDVTVTAMRDVVAPEMRSRRLGATMFAAFGALALLVAASVATIAPARRASRVDPSRALRAE